MPPVAPATPESGQLGFDTPSPSHELRGLPATVPWIRESACGKAHQRRLTALSRAGLGAPAGPTTGPSDLLLWQRYYGVNSPVFLANPFASPAENDENDENRDEGYVSYYHYCNGLDYSVGASAVDAYVMAALGLEPISENPRKFRWKPSAKSAVSGASPKNAMVATLCSYNVFSKAEFRARYDVSMGKSRRDPVSVVAHYTIKNSIHDQSSSTHEYSGERIREVAANFWNELAASTLVRMYMSVDDPAGQLCGTVNLRSQLCDSSGLLAAAGRLVALLPKGHSTGLPPRYGKINFFGADDVKTSRFRNYLVDTLVKVCVLDASGSAAAHVVEKIQKTYRNDFDYVIARIYAADCSRNHRVDFLQLVRENVVRDPVSCQTALLLVEQVRFLLAQGSYGQAVKIAGETVALLPTDFEAWYNLALCYLLSGEPGRALEMINSFPSPLPRKAEFGEFDVETDAFASVFMERMYAGETPIDIRTFDAFFPPPKEKQEEKEKGREKSEKSEIGAFPSSPKKKVKERKGDRDLGAMHRLWYDEFSYQPDKRHPTCGPFQRTPASLASPMERSTVDSAILAAAGVESPKLVLAAQSARNPWSSLLDFEQKSTWGRTYDLFTCLVALVGWDNFVRLKHETFKDSEREEDEENKEKGSKEKEIGFVVDQEKLARPECKEWLAILFRLVYDDLYLMLRVSGQDHSRSVLEWSLIGLLGWGCKFNLRDSVSAIFTSNSGSAQNGSFDYYGTVKMLQIHNEVVLSDAYPSSIDHFAGLERSHSAKFILHSWGEKRHRQFVENIQRDHFSVDSVLLAVTKLVSWNLRWYQYMPNSLVCETLTKLAAQHDVMVLRSRLHILAVTLQKQAKKTKGNFTLKSMFAPPAEPERANYEFVEGDTAVEYVNSVLDWLEKMKQNN